MNYLTEEPIQLLDALRKMYPDSSNKSLRDMLKNRRVSVDDRVVIRADFALEPGQQVSVGVVHRRLFKGVRIIYEDRSLIAINKPAKLLSVPLDSRNSAHALGILHDYFHTDQIYAVHRLDREASGVMIFARGKQSATRLGEMFTNHDLNRVYTAIVQGELNPDQGSWKSYLEELESYRVRVTNEKEGKEAITHFTVIRRSKNFTFLRLTLETGKKHQIRVHCTDAGHPIAGDKMYGPPSCNPISRMCLHASLLEFVHPFTGKKMSFSAPLPTAFVKLGLKRDNPNGRK
ncbi:MAG: Ribosomal large subunit pseudouridine synthase D [Chlamydiae bacterium]|nr:Ribosomal large subunit pseudouridine synthase D [Chlamydiota bacterium]